MNSLALCILSTLPSPSAVPTDKNKNNKNISSFSFHILKGRTKEKTNLIEIEFEIELRLGNNLIKIEKKSFKKEGCCANESKYRHDSSRRTKARMTFNAPNPFREASRSLFLILILVRHVFMRSPAEGYPKISRPQNLFRQQNNSILTYETINSSNNHIHNTVYQIKEGRDFYMLIANTNRNEQQQRREAKSR